MKFKDVKVFDMRNPNFTINNEIGIIVSMLNQRNVPVVDKIYDCFTEFDKSRVIGIVDKVTKTNENEIFADILIFDRFDKGFEAKELNYKNYCVYIKNYDKDNNCADIDYIDCIEVERVYSIITEA